ncbi:MAG: triose-phosphate isomerase [Desulfuromonadales bacterium]
MRMPVIAGNWKLHKTIDQSRILADELKDLVSGIDDVEIIVAPVFTSLSTVSVSLEESNIQLAAQNCYCENEGAFTGEVSPAMIQDSGCTHVILGHSERRHLFNESDGLINQKIRAALAEGLTVIFCIGETLEERESEQMYDVLSHQVREGLSGITEDEMKRMIIAYEPVWAIGTGKVATTDQAEEAHAFVRGLVQGLYDERISDETRILYGGSVKPDNVDGLLAQEDIDGALVGGASLKAEDFNRIARFNRS